MCVCFVIRLLEKEFQMWKVAKQSEHESLENRCTELEATMEALIHHNQQLEQELGHVRHVSGENQGENRYMVTIISGMVQDKFNYCIFWFSLPLAQNALMTKAIFSLKEYTQFSALFLSSLSVLFDYH